MLRWRLPMEQNHWQMAPLSGGFQRIGLAGRHWLQKPSHFPHAAMLGGSSVSKGSWSVCLKKGQ
ncbi:protein of unknown function (plasmid) [Candidatus Methylocalor cossyra]|uniref:Uncharacterized protein n=1 Tax=Candidatus Methylocalor cossyra TaxID=3108543 RepID=A0ABM9NMU0_9GAMM